MGGRTSVRHELENRVDLHLLDPGGVVNALGAHQPVGLFGPACRPVVPVVEGGPEKVAGRIEQAVVDAPAVDTCPQGPVCLTRHPGQALEHALVDT